MRIPNKLLAAMAFNHAEKLEAEWIQRKNFSALLKRGSDNGHEHYESRLGFQILVIDSAARDALAAALRGNATSQVNEGNVFHPSSATR